MKLQDGAAFRDLAVFSLAGAVLRSALMDRPQIKSVSGNWQLIDIYALG